MIDRHSLRVRLTMTFVTVGFVLVAAGYAGTAWLLKRAVWHPLDAALLEEASAVELFQETEADDDANAGMGPRVRTPKDDADDIAAAAARLAGERDLGPSKFVFVLSPAGHVIAAAGQPPNGISALLAGPVEAARFVVADGSPYRIAGYRMREGGSVLIGVRVDRQMRTLHRALAILAIGALGMLAGVGVLAWSITTRATREIEDVAGELEGLEADALARRIEPRTTTEVARLTDALNRLLARLELAQRRLQRFTADAAHEIRTPLAALRATLDVAVARHPSVAGDRNALLDAIEQAERLSVLAEDLLTLSTIESADLPTPDSVNMAGLASEVAGFLEPVAQEQKRQFEVEVDDGTGVLGEAALLRRLLLNLLGNAFTHTPHGVAVSLSVRRGDGEVVLVVRDRGRGIAPADPPLLFERFGRHRSGGGAGLGLAICREIVVRHRGTIALDSGPQGTMVTVRLPAAGS